MRPARESWRAGLRAGVPFGLAGGMVAVSFGALADQAGIGPVAAVVFSAIVFAGSAQFAAVGILIAGGGLITAIAAAALMNSRFLPMGVALAPDLPGRGLWRATQGQAVVDASWALARGEDGRFDRWFLFGCSAVQYVGWVGGTAIGAVLGARVLDAEALGLDAIFPAFFLVLLLGELRRPGRRWIAVAGAALALVLVPLAPPGVPVLVASAAALAGLREVRR